MCDPFSGPRWARSWRFPKSVACITDTSGGRPNRVPLAADHSQRATLATIRTSGGHPSVLPNPFRGGPIARGCRPALLRTDRRAVSRRVGLSQAPKLSPNGRTQFGEGQVIEQPPAVFAHRAGASRVYFSNSGSRLIRSL